MLDTHSWRMLPTWAIGATCASLSSASEALAHTLTKVAEDPSDKWIAPDRKRISTSEGL